MHCGLLLTKQGDDNITAELSAFFGQGDALILAVFGQLAELVKIRSAVMVADDGGDTIDITAVACGKNGLRGENDGRARDAEGKTIFLITGKNKADVVEEICNSGDTGPAAYVAHHAQNVELFMDKGAAAYIEDPNKKMS